ncbi:hypothetical protein [Croceibacterium aestuarii]|uniref:hypothetical protein n=1 Tax=Croceibacterium aestuarii TaxID=3064139 RepID=UPI00272EE40E|nr:hypothetical protein [Croceibacterium sp. D39]
MNDRENKQQSQSQSSGGERPGPGTGAGSRQHEQQTFGGTMDTDVNPGDGQPQSRSRQAEQEERTASQMGQEGRYTETQASMDSPGDATAQQAGTAGERGGQMEQSRNAQQSQAEHVGGTYHPAGDRGLEFESGNGNEIGLDTSQPGETGRRDRQPEQEDSERRRQAEQQDGGGQSGD